MGNKTKDDDAHGGRPMSALRKTDAHKYVSRSVYDGIRKIDAATAAKRAAALKSSLRKATTPKLEKV
jgi:hypothetical protein